MLKITIVNGLIINRRGDANQKEDIQRLLDKNIEFRSVGKTIKFVNPKGQHVIWNYIDNNRFSIKD